MREKQRHDPLRVGRVDGSSHTHRVESIPMQIRGKKEEEGDASLLPTFLQGVGISPTGILLRTL